jgi:RNA polymerase sigma-70 factor (ECF subfamily)
MTTPSHLPGGSATKSCVECFQLRNCRPCFEELVERFQPSLLQFLTHRLGSREDAEDAFQEVFLLVYRKIGGYNPSFGFTTWLFAIARRVAITHHRRRRPVDVACADPQRAIDPGTAIEQREQRGRLWDTVRELLAPDHFTAVWLYYVEEMSADEIGKVLGRNANAVRIILHRSRAKLAEKLPGQTFGIAGSSHGK